MLTEEIVWIYDGEWEAKEPRFSADSKRVAYILNKNGTMDIYVYDLESGESIPLNIPPGICSSPKFSNTGDFLVVIHSGPKSPPDLWRFELQEGTWTRLTNSLQGNIDLSLLAEPMELWWTSFDGRRIPGLFYPTSNYAGPGKPPCIVWPHGGPTGQSVNRWNPYLQYMVAQGYSVLAPNVRGSTGYGAEFRDLNLKDWGGGDLRDLVAGVDYIIKQGLVNGSKICIVGISYGGYLTLMAMTKFPKKWAAGCSICGVVNLKTLWDTTRGDLRGYLKMQLGRPEDNPELYYDRSPINFVDQIEAPLQIQQGANDPRVPRAEAEQIVSALRKMGKDCDYILYQDEGHVFLKIQNKIDSIKRAVQFFNERVRDI